MHEVGNSYKQIAAHCVMLFTILKSNCGVSSASKDGIRDRKTSVIKLPFPVTIDSIMPMQKHLPRKYIFSSNFQKLKKWKKLSCQFHTYHSSIKGDISEDFIWNVLYFPKSYVYIIFIATGNKSFSFCKIDLLYRSNFNLRIQLFVL